MKMYAMNVLLICQLLLLRYVSAIPSYFMDEMCGQTIDMGDKQIESGQLLLRRPEATGLRNQKCIMYIKSPNGKNLVLQFTNFYLESPFGCTRDYVEVFEGLTNTSRSLIGKHCGRDPPTTAFTTSGDRALITFSRYVRFFHDQFYLTFTAYHRGACGGNEFTCHNGRCIHKDLHCDEYDNCGDGSDKCLMTTAGIAGVVLGCIIVVVIIAIIIAVILIRRRRKSINQQMRGVSTYRR